MRSLDDLYQEMVRPDSPATRNERDAAALLIAGGLNSRAVADMMVEVRRYYERVHLGAMSTNLTAVGA